MTGRCAVQRSACGRCPRRSGMRRCGTRGTNRRQSVLTCTLGAPFFRRSMVAALRDAMHDALSVKLSFGKFCMRLHSVRIPTARSVSGRLFRRISAAPREAKRWRNQSIYSARDGGSSRTSPVPSSLLVTARVPCQFGRSRRGAASTRPRSISIAVCVGPLHVFVSVTAALISRSRQRRARRRRRDLLR